MLYAHNAAAPAGARADQPFHVKANQPKAAKSMKSSIIKRSIELNGHKTSVSLEDEFWSGLRAIAETGRIPLPELLQTIDAKRGQANLSSAIRVYVLVHYRELATAQAIAQAALQAAAQAPEQPTVPAAPGSSALPAKSPPES